MLESAAMDNESSIEAIRVQLMGVKGHYPKIAQISGLSYSWLCKFAQGSQRNPTLKSIDALRKAIDAFAQTDRPSKAA